MIPIIKTDYLTFTDLLSMINNIKFENIKWDNFLFI